jgi:hypothetical protein
MRGAPARSRRPGEPGRWAVRLHARREVCFTWRPQLADAGDEMVLEAAVNGQAQALVTHNIADFAEAAPRFGLALLRPGELLDRIGRG